MPTNTYDASQMKLYLKDYIAEVKGLSTNDEFVKNDSKPSTAMNKLHQLTEKSYTLGDFLYILHCAVRSVLAF